MVFRQARHDGGAKITAMGLYFGLTQEYRWQITDLNPPAFDEVVVDALRQRDPFWMTLHRKQQ